jgi:hypothetical protein
MAPRKGHKRLTVDDFRRLSHVFRSVTGTTLGGLLGTRPSSRQYASSRGWGLEEYQSQANHTLKVVMDQDASVTVAFLEEEIFSKVRTVLAIV